MISIRKSVNDLEHLDDLEALSTTILDSYAMAINASAHYSVEIDSNLSLDFRKNLQGIEDQVRAASSPDQIRAAQSSFRGELREYRDKSVEQLKGMRKQVDNASSAMLIFADTVASNGINHEKEMLSEIGRLETSAHCGDIQEIRVAVGKAVIGIEASVMQIQRGNQVVIAQLRDEIRTLHQQFEQERKALYTDRASGAWNRSKIDTHLDNMLRQNQPFPYCWYPYAILRGSNASIPAP